MPEPDPLFVEIERIALDRYETRAAFANALGLKSEQTFNNWRNRGVPERAELRGRIADLLGLDRNALIFDSQAVESDRNEGAPRPDNIGPGPYLQGDIPLISWVQAGAWHEAYDPNEPGEGEPVACPFKHGPRTYALRVEGDSMTAPYGTSFPHGLIICVDPDQSGGIANGQFVIARVEGEDLVTFKQYVTDGDRHYLKPLNPQYETISRPFRVLGRVIGGYFQT